MEWISVKESMPIAYTTVFVCWLCGEKEEGYMIAYYDSDKKVFIDAWESYQELRSVFKWADPKDNFILTREEKSDVVNTRVAEAHSHPPSHIEDNSGFAP